MTNISLAVNEYVAEHRLPIGLGLLAIALVGTAISAQGLSLREAMAALRIF